MPTTLLSRSEACWPIAPNHVFNTIMVLDAIPLPCVRKLAKKPAATTGSVVHRHHVGVARRARLEIPTVQAALPPAFRQYGLATKVLGKGCINQNPSQLGQFVAELRRAVCDAWHPFMMIIASAKLPAQPRG